MQGFPAELQFAAASLVRSTAAKEEVLRPQLIDAVLEHL